MLEVYSYKMIDPVILSVFGVDLYWYGLIYSIGFLIGYFMIKKELKRFIVSDFRYDIFFFGLVFFSILGSRFFEVFFYRPEFYFSDFKRIFEIWRGGLAIHGSFLFGFLYVLLVSRYVFKFKDGFSGLNYESSNFLNQFKESLNLTLLIFDVIVLYLAYFLSLGRIANFINQELVGVPSKYFCVVFSRVDDLCRVPVQLLDSFKNLFLFNLLFIFKFFLKDKEFIFLGRKYNLVLKNGFMTALFLIFYNFGRFLVDFLKVPVKVVSFNFLFLSFSLGLGQLFSLVYFLFGLLFLVYVLKK